MTSTVYIAKTVYGGDGLGRLGDGRVVFVPGAFAGEQVKAEIVEEKKHFVRARLVEIVEPSKDRTGTGECPVPGMVYANLSRKAELAAKEEQLKGFFERARIGVESGPVRLGGDGALNYRNKVVYHFGTTRRGERVLGYRREPSHEIVDVAQDPLARPEINAALGEIRRNAFALLTQGAAAVRRDVGAAGNLTVRWSRASGVKWWIGEKAPTGIVMKEQACGKIFEVPADGFWQMNPDVAEAMYAAVAEEYARGAAVAPDVVDLYCGVGVLGLTCRPPRLWGVESGKAAVEFAKRNAAALGRPDARFSMDQAAHAVRRLSLGARTTVIVDPPRSGMEPGVVKALLRGKAPRILYASCDPATLVRDVRALGGAYAVKALKWFDMFPRTARFETLAVLERKGANG